MKKLYLLAVLITAISNFSYSQNRNSFYHIISNDVKIIYTDQDNNVQQIKICSKQLKGVVSLDKGVPVIDFWSISDNDYIDKPECISKNTKLGRFTLDLSPRKKLGDPTKYVNIPFRAWTFGIGTTPFRFRPKTDSSFSTVSSNLGLSINYGRTWGVSKVSPRAIINKSFTFGPFLGVSSVDLKKSTVKNPSNWKTDRTNVAISYGINGIIARNNLGIVISIGLDANMGKDSKQWSYQNRPWFGLGINTSLGYF